MFGRQLKPLKLRSTFQDPTEEQIKKARKRLVEMTRPAAIGALDPDNYTDYIPDAVKNPPPPSFKNLFRKELSGAEYDSVLKVCNDEIPTLLSNVNKNYCQVIEKLTRQQRESKYWSIYRLGRITGSKFKETVSANVEKPPYSLIRNICYPATSGSKMGVCILRNICQFKSTFFFKCHPEKNWENYQHITPFPYVGNRKGVSST
jgi:hypothetical protein